MVWWGEERKESPSAQRREADQPAWLRDAVCVRNTSAAEKPERGSSGFQDPSQLMEIITSATFPISSSGILIFNKLILTN